MDKLQSLYDALSGRFNLGSFDEFQKKIQDPEKRKALYEAASSEFELGDFDSFSFKIEDSFKKKDDGESLSQEDTTGGEFGFYTKTNEDAFKAYTKEYADKYQKVIQNDPTLVAITDNVQSELIRTRDRILDSYIYDPNFNPQDPEMLAKANQDITERLRVKELELLGNNEEFNKIKSKYESEYLDDIQKELQVRLQEEALNLSDNLKDTFFNTIVPESITGGFLNLFSKMTKGEGIIPVMGDSFAFQIPQSFKGWDVKNDELEVAKINKGIDTVKELDPNAPVYLNDNGEIINPAEYGGQMKRDLEQGTLSAQSANGTLMTAEQALQELDSRQEVKAKEIAPKLKEALDMQEFISRVNKVKPLSEDASFSNIIKTLAQQVPNMGVAMLLPVAGTAILEGGNTYLDQIQEIARQRFGDDFTTEDLLSIVESGEGGAEQVTGAAFATGLIDLVGLGGIGNFISKGAQAVGKQILKEGVRQGIKNISKSQIATIGKTIAGAGLSEGITEGLQGANMQFSKINTVERATGVRPDFDFGQVLEEAVIGGLMGGLMGGAGGITTALANRSKANLPDNITLDDGERTYFDGADAITRKQAIERVKRANSLQELEKIRVKNDDQIAAAIEEKRLQFPTEEAAPETVQKAKKTFNPKGFYEAIDEQGNPIVSFTDQETGMTEFESSETPQLSASKTIGGAITGLFSMKRSTGQKPSGTISIYKIDSKPDVEINPVNIADFAFIDEVRYNSKVEGTEIAKIELDENTIDFLADFYNSFEATEEEYNALLSKYNANDRAELEGIFKDRIKSIYPSSDTGYFRAEFTSTEEATPEVAPEITQEPETTITDETTIAEGNRLFNEPLQEASTIADRFTQRKGFDSAGIEQAPKLEVEKAQRIAKAFDELQPAPQDEAVMRAYNALAEETLEQYQEILADGYRVEINNDEPYASSADMIRDLKENKRMKIFSTESGFGDEAITDEQRASNPLLKDSGFTDANGQPLLINDVFRFVHDFFGHAKLGNGFGPKGEEVAWFVHSKMYSDDARRALTTETRGQNSWVNFSGVNDEAFQARDRARDVRQQAQAETDTQKKIALLEEAGRLVDEAYNKMSFAEQKIGLLPDEFVFEEPTRIVDQEVAPEEIVAEDKPVEEAKPVKTPEMEDVEEDIARLQSDIETYEIQVENLQEEIEIEKGNLKEDLAAINDKIKEVRASKKPAATKREEIEELQAEKQDIRDENESLIQGYKEEIKDAKREAKKAANRIKRLTAKLETIKPAEPVAETVKETDEDQLEVREYEGLLTDKNAETLDWALNTKYKGKNVNFEQPYAVETDEKVYFQYFDKSEDAGTYSVKYSLEFKKNKDGSLSRTGVRLVEDTVALLPTKKTQPATEEKKVVGTIEIEDVEEKVSVKAELKAAGSVGFTLIEEGDASGKEMIEDALDKYNAQLNVVIDESNPLSRISNDDTAADKKAFEEQNPKLKNVVKMLRATTKFKGLSQFHNMPIRVIVYEKMSDMDAVLDFVDDADEFTNGFFDADSNTVFVALDATAENVLAHEFIHPIVQRIIYSNPQLMRELAAEAKKNKGIQDFIKQYKIEQRNEEAVVQYVSLAVQKHINAGRTLPQRIRDFFMRILDKIGINKGIVFDDVKQLDDLIRLVTEGFVSGRVFQDKALMAISEVKVLGENIAQIKLSERPELGEVKRIDAKQLDKKRVVATLYDNLKTGDVTWTNPVTRKQYVFEGKKGGPLHMFLKENLKNNVVAAFTRLAVARKFAARAEESDALVYTLMSTESSLEANRDVFKDIFGVVVADIEDFVTFKKDLSSILNTAGTQKFKEDLMGINNAQQLTSYLDNLTFAQRRAIFKKVFPKVVGTPQQRIMQSKYGMPTSGEIVNVFSEETMNNAKSGDTFAAAKIRPVILVNEKEFKRISKATFTKYKNEGIEIKQMPKESEHASYPYAIEGEPIGLFNKFVNVRDMLPYVPKDATTWIKYVEGNGAIDTTSQIIEDESVRLLAEEGTEEARISAAPIRSFKQWFQNKFKDKAPTVEDIKKVQNTKEFKSYRKKYLDSARLFNLTPGNIFNNAGVFVGDVEYSNSITVQGDMADMRALAAFMGLTEGPQESVVISRPNPQGNGRAIDIFYDNPKKSTKGADELVDLGIDGMSYSFEENKITIYVDETNDQKVTEIIEKYYDESKVKSIEYTRADVEFVEESEYRQILESYRSEGRNLGEGKRPLRNAINEALGESPLNPFGNAPSRMKQSKSNRQNVINPAKVVQERFSKKLTPKRVGSTYAVDLEILTTIDIEELANLADMSGANVGINLLKEYNKVVADLADVTMPGARDLEPARILANKIREALDFSTQEKIVEYAYLLLAMTEGDPSGITSDKEVIDLIKQGLEEGGDFTLSELEADEQIEFEQFIVNNIGEIRQYASDVHFANLRSTKFSDRMKGTKYENREALLKNDIVRTATKILIEQRDALAEMGTPASVDQLGLSDFHAETIAEALGGGDELANLLRTNLKSLTNMAQNDLRNQNIVSGIVEISRRFNTRGIPQKFIKGKLFADQNVVDKILSIVKNGFTADEVKVLEDYMEYHENRKILKTIQSIQHGYMPPMAYGIINKFIQATEAIKLAGNIDNMTVMLDANDRIIRDAVAAREAKELTELADQIAPETLSKRTTTAAISAFDNVRDKAVTKVYNVVDSALQKVEAIREVMINNLNNKFALIKPIARFEGKQYTNMDVSMLGHMYMIEKQFLANPGNPKVPKLKENLIDSITDKTSEENRRYIELYNDFKKDNGVLDIRKTERFLREMNALNDATQESGMAFINYYRKISQDMQFRIKFIQEFQRKTKVELFDEYVFVATKGKGGSVEAKADLIESMLRMDASGRWTGGIAKTSISRRNYISANKTFVKFTDREPVFDLMFSANYMLNEGLSSYHVGEAYRDVVSRLNILSKMGDNETSALAQAIRNDITSRIRNAVEYKLDRSKGVIDSAVMKLLGGTYRAYLASVNRVVELLTNSVYVGISDPAIAKEIIRNSKDTFLSNQTADETQAIMNKTGSVHIARFNKVGKSFYSAEGIGTERLKGQAPSIWDGLGDKLKKKDGEYRQLYVAYKDAINQVGVLSTGLKDWTDAWVRMSDTRIASISWNTIFKRRFKELTDVDYDSAMLEDQDLFLRYRIAMKEASNHADVFISEGFSGSSFAMNQNALKNKGTVKYIENMFRTFRTFRYETTRNAIRSLIGLKDGTMSKEEAAKKLTAVLVSELMYSLGTQVAVTKLFELVAVAMGAEIPDDEEDEFKSSFQLALAQLASTMAFGRLSAIRFGLLAGTTKAVVRTTQGDDLSTLEGLKNHLQRMKMTNYFMRQTVPILGDPTNVALDAGVSLIDVLEGEAPKEDLLIDAFKMIAVYRGVPFTGDIAKLYRAMNQSEQPKKKKGKYKSSL